MEVNAEVSARVKLLRPGAMPSYGEKGEQRTALHRGVWDPHIPPPSVPHGATTLTTFVAVSVRNIYLHPVQASHNPSSIHAHMRLPFCAIHVDKKLTFATPRVLISYCAPAYAGLLSKAGSKEATLDHDHDPG
jgi:hypothetical protein